MKKEDFIKVIDSAIKQGKCIKVHIRVPNLNEPEIISNPPENLITKKAYYQKRYNEDMEMVHFNAIFVEHIEITDTL